MLVHSGCQVETSIPKLTQNPKIRMICIDSGSDDDGRIIGIHVTPIFRAIIHHLGGRIIDDQGHIHDYYGPTGRKERLQDD